MHTDTPTRKSPGRLSREDQRRLGDILQRVYDDVIRQGVPDRFKELLDELEEPGEKGQAARPGESVSDLESERVFGVKSAAQGSKGSH
jgi:hypothetical protein